MNIFINRNKNTTHPHQGFTLIELLVSITIIGILTTIGLNSFSSSQKKARDTKRKNHLKSISQAVETYYNDKGQYPEDDNGGNLMGCGTDAEEVCTWGLVFSNTSTSTETIYMIELPEDPSTGNSYWYEADPNGKWFQIYARLENTNDAAVPVVLEIPQVFDGVICNLSANIECNYGISSPNTTEQTGQSLVNDPTI